MSKIKNGSLDQYGTEPFEQQQFEIAGTERVKHRVTATAISICSPRSQNSRGLLKTRITWIENAYSRPHLSANDFDPQSRPDGLCGCVDVCVLTRVAQIV